MKKLLFLLIYFLIVGNVLISGCTDKENSMTDISSSQSDISSSQSDISSSEYDYNSLPEAGFLPNRYAQDAYREQYETFKDRNYPSLDNINVEFESPNMELIGSYLVDERTYKSDPNWVAHLVIRNKGNDGVWIGNMEGLYKVPRLDYRYHFLSSGDIMIYGIVGDLRGGTPYLSHINLDNLLNGDVTFTIKGCDTTTPTVSSKFGQFYLEHQITNSKHILDVESIEYKVDSNNWRYVVIKVNNPTSTELSGSVKVVVDGADSGYSKSEDGMKFFTLKPGGSETFEMNLRDNLPVSLSRVILSTVQK